MNKGAPLINVAGIDPKSLEAKLPMLGPLIGWTREEPPGAWKARLWAKADDGDGQLAEFALTTRYDERTGMCTDSKLWRVFGLCLQEDWPKAQERFAMADIAFDPGKDDVERSMVFLHRDLSRQPSAALLPSAAPIFFVEKGKLVGDVSASMNFTGGDYDAASKLDLDGTLPSAALLEIALDESSTLDRLAETWFRKLKATLQAQKQVPRPRPRDRDAALDDCAVRVRGALAGKAGTPLTFAAGCCRHPGMQFDRELSDRALGALGAAMRGGPEEVRFTMMLGDQIYADATAGVLDVADSLEKYTTRYYEAFRSPGFRAVARTAPVYMTGDDHEVRDGWPVLSAPLDCDPADPIDGDPGAEWAWLTFLGHQRAHGPQLPPWARSAVSRGRAGRPSFWYAFEHSGVPFFVFDTRFERTRVEGDDLVRQVQLDAFDAWIAQLAKLPAGLRHVPKFIASGSVFAPAESEFTLDPQYGRRADSWMGYDKTRAKVLERIIEADLTNVVFLSGDYHCAAAGALALKRQNRPDRWAYTIVAPPFYAPFPFANLPSDRVVVEEDTKFNALTPPISLQCRAQALDVQGFAMITVGSEVAEPRAPGDWAVRVCFFADDWHPVRKGERQTPIARARECFLLKNGGLSTL